MQSKIHSDFRNKNKFHFGYTICIETVHVIVFKILITYIDVFDFIIGFLFLFIRGYLKPKCTYSIKVKEHSVSIRK